MQAPQSLRGPRSPKMGAVQTRDPIRGHGGGSLPHLATRCGCPGKGSLLYEAGPPLFPTPTPCDGIWRLAAGRIPAGKQQASSRRLSGSTTRLPRRHLTNTPPCIRTILFFTFSPPSFRPPSVCLSCTCFLQTHPAQLS